MPFSVSGCFSICFSTLPGTVATSQPSVAAVVACIRWRSEAASTWASDSPAYSASTISASTAVESTEMSSTRPMKQET